MHVMPTPCMHHACSLHAALLPSILLGPALGAAAVYGAERGDPLAAGEVVRVQARRAGRVVKEVVAVRGWGVCGGGMLGHACAWTYIGTV